MFILKNDVIIKAHGRKECALALLLPPKNPHFLNWKWGYFLWKFLIKSVDIRYYTVYNVLKVKETNNSNKKGEIKNDKERFTNRI